MAMTSAVKDELSRYEVTKTCCRKAEVATMLRFGGGLHIVSGKIVIEAELDTGSAARRLRTNIKEVYGHDAELAVVHAGGLRKGNRYLVRVRTARSANRIGGRIGSPGSWIATAGRHWRDVRHRSCMAWRIPGSRIVNGTGSVVLVGNHLPRT